MTSFTSNTLFQETRPEDRKTMEEILSAQAALQSACAMWADECAPDIIGTLSAVNDKDLGCVTPGATCSRSRVFLVVSDSSLVLISGGKKNRKIQAQRGMRPLRGKDVLGQGSFVSRLDRQEHNEGAQQSRLLRAGVLVREQARRQRRDLRRA